MKIIKAKPNQTIYDIALEQYGTAEAVAEIVMNNPSLTNDPAALTALGIDAINEDGFYLDIAVLPGMSVAIDDESLFIQHNTVKQITDDITTFELQYGTDN